MVCCILFSWWCFGMEMLSALLAFCEWIPPVSIHYNDVKMGAIASQITSLTIVYSTDQRKHESSTSLAFVRGIHQGLVNSPHKWPVTRRVFPFDDIIMPHKCLAPDGCPAIIWTNDYPAHWICASLGLNELMLEIFKDHVRSNRSFSKRKYWI